MDQITHRHRRIVATLLFGLVLELLILYPKSYLAFFVEAALVFGLIYWLMMNK